MSQPRVLAAAGGLALALITTGCSEGSDAFNKNRPDDRPETTQKLVIRSPEVVPPDLPYETPPLVPQRGGPVSE